MRNSLTLAATLSLAILAGCDGPKESAGRAADKAAAAANGQTLTQEGPNELMGEAEDRADRADRKALDAQADLLEQRADQLRQEAAGRADAIDKQAQALRNGAN